METMLMRHISLTFAILIMASSWAQAESRMYVTDRIVLDMYEDSTRLSQVLQQLPTGTAVDLIGNNGPFAEVRLLSGSTGWVENSFLTDEKPMQVLYAELMKKYKTAQDQLKNAASQPAPASVPDTSKADREEIARLQTQLSVANARVRKAEDQLAKVQTVNTDDNSKVSLLETENLRLREQLDTVTTTSALQNGALASKNAYRSGRYDVPPLWFAFGILVFLIIGVVSGIALLDWRIRRRHGGFRIY